jgi:hypothetical protein
VYELPLVQALVAQHRRFVKPLRYDAKSAAAFPNVLLLDTGLVPIPLHVVSPFMAAKDISLKKLSVRVGASSSWLWSSIDTMPDLPAANLK